MIDFENSHTSASSFAIYKGTTINVLGIDNNTIAGSSIATTWIHGRSVLFATQATYFIVSPVVGTQAISTAGSAPQFTARITILKIA